MMTKIEKKPSPLLARMLMRGGEGLVAVTTIQHPGIAGWRMPTAALIRVTFRHATGLMDYQGPISATILDAFGFALASLYVPDEGESVVEGGLK